MEACITLYHKFFCFYCSQWVGVPEADGWVAVLRLQDKPFVTAS